MIKTKDEILSALKAQIGESMGDDVLTLLEDITDTLTDFETKTKDTTDWKSKYESNDADWRKKYKDRFFEGEKEEKTEFKLPVEPESEPVKETTFDDLFK